MDVNEHETKNKQESKVQRHRITYFKKEINDEVNEKWIEYGINWIYYTIQPWSNCTKIWHHHWWRSQREGSNTSQKKLIKCSSIWMLVTNF